MTLTRVRGYSCAHTDIPLQNPRQVSCAVHIVHYHRYLILFAEGYCCLVHDPQPLPLHILVRQGHEAHCIRVLHRVTIVDPINLVMPAHIGGFIPLCQPSDAKQSALRKQPSGKQHSTGLDWES